MIYIGIDPGTKPGIAIFDSKIQQLTFMKKYQSVLLAQRDLLKHRDTVTNDQIFVILEDARKRKFFGGEGDISRKAQGAGSVKRDSQLWEEWLIFHDFKYDCVTPKNTKYKHELFCRITGWKKSTNKETRDAGMLVWGRENYLKF